MAFTDDADHVRVVYENGSVELESSMDGQTALIQFRARKHPQLDLGARGDGTAAHRHSDRMALRP